MLSTKKIKVHGQLVKDGEDGVGISSIEQTKSSSEDGGENEITITLTNGNVYVATIKNGNKGSKGDKGDKGDTGATGSQGPKGDTGATGPQGLSGVYVGSGTMPSGYNVQIDPTGERDPVCTKEEFNNLGLYVANGMLMDKWEVN